VVRRAAIGAKEDEHALPLMVIQLVGRTPEWIAKGARLAEDAGADIIDFNMGCPAKEVTGALSGSALMREPELAARLIEAAVNATSRPVTLKMRLGWDDQNRNAPEIAVLAERLGVKAITVHGRTRQQFYGGAADWRAVAAVKRAVGLPVIVNGDILDGASARAALEQSGADAVMIGRGAYGRPWIAAELDRALYTGAPVSEPGVACRLGIALEHFTDTLRFYGDTLGLKIFRKHLGWYVERALCPANPALRRSAKARLCQIDNAKGVESALTELWAALSSHSALPIFAPAHM
jgi:nifR3 family TIM-barrel protein